ncbi:MAG: AAA family ATPase [Acidimicrobiia bacterium]|nr:AAA family ATPase [Acidimicrobiia bacterium]
MRVRGSRPRDTDAAAHAHDVGPADSDLQDTDVLRETAVLRGRADVSDDRERHRQRRLFTVVAVLAVAAAFMYLRWATGNPVQLGLPAPPEWLPDYLPVIILGTILVGALMAPLLFAGRSPHVLYRPSEISVRFDDVRGLGIVKEEVVKTLNLFLAYKTFRDRMGGTPRRALLFEGPPGTGKTYMAKAMAAEAGVPFLFASASSFQSMYYGQTNRKIRSYFRSLRKAARKEGGAIGFLEEIDAIAGARSGMRFSPVPADLSIQRALDGSDATGAVNGRSIEHAGRGEGISGVVNELLVQLQSFDEPTVGRRLRGAAIDLVNRWLPESRQFEKRPPTSANILVIGATNRAADLDPALLRPGRFDRSIHFDLPGRSGRREIVDYYLDKKAHVPELDKEERRDQLAAMTFGYSPVMIEHLLDEALVWSLRDERDAMDWGDLQQAKFTEEIGLKQPVEYTDDEKCSIATHEAGHAVMAHVVGVDRKLEVLSIIKRREALGLLAHSDLEERFTKTRSELTSQIQIALGGMTAEELFLGESGTGPGSDLAAATRIAAVMVGALGMAGSLVSFEAVEAGPVSQGLVTKVLADKEARAAVERLLDQAKTDVRTTLDENRHLVAALRDELLIRDELIGDEILDVLAEAEAARELEAGGEF